MAEAAVKGRLKREAVQQERKHGWGGSTVTVDKQGNITPDPPGRSVLDNVKPNRAEGAK